jgi:hypothetical protein
VPDTVGLCDINRSDGGDVLSSQSGLNCAAWFRSSQIYTFCKPIDSYRHAPQCSLALLVVVLSLTKTPERILAFSRTDHLPVTTGTERKPKESDYASYGLAIKLGKLSGILENALEKGFGAVVAVDQLTFEVDEGDVLRTRVECGCLSSSEGRSRGSTD